VVEFKAVSFIFAMVGRSSVGICSFIVCYVFVKEDVKGEPETLPKTEFSRCGRLRIWALSMIWILYLDRFRTCKRVLQTSID
jgi:uncharacterized membrane protein